jgi:hypothetical protein
MGQPLNANPKPYCLAPDSSIGADYKAALARDMAHQLKGFSTMCRYFGWNAAQPHLIAAHEQLLELSRQNQKIALADTGTDGSKHSAKRPMSGRGLV